MRRFSVKPDGTNRIVEIDGAYLRLVMSVDQHGGVSVIEHEHRDPSALSAADIQTAAARAEVCRACDQCRGVRLELNGRDVYRVNCKTCGCGGLSLVRGRCPLKRW